MQSSSHPHTWDLEIATRKVFQQFSSEYHTFYTNWNSLQKTKHISLPFHEIKKILTQVFADLIVLVILSSRWNLELIKFKDSFGLMRIILCEGCRWMMSWMDQDWPMEFLEFAQFYCKDVTPQKWYYWVDIQQSSVFWDKYKSNPN